MRLDFWNNPATRDTSTPLRAAITAEREGRGANDAIQVASDDSYERLAAILGLSPGGTVGGVTVNEHNALGFASVWACVLAISQPGIQIRSNSSVESIQGMFFSSVLTSCHSERSAFDPSFCSAHSSAGAILLGRHRSTKTPTFEISSCLRQTNLLRRQLHLPRLSRGQTSPLSCLPHWRSQSSSLSSIKTSHSPFHSPDHSQPPHQAPSTQP